MKFVIRDSGYQPIFSYLTRHFVKDETYHSLVFLGWSVVVQNEIGHLSDKYGVEDSSNEEGSHCEPDFDEGCGGRVECVAHS